MWPKSDPVFNILKIDSPVICEHYYTPQRRTEQKEMSQTLSYLHYTLSAMMAAFYHLDSTQT